MKNFYENPEIQSLNRLPMRSHLIPFDSTLTALTECAEGPETHEKSESAFIKYLCHLDGTISPEIQNGRDPAQFIFEGLIGFLQ